MPSSMPAVTWAQWVTTVTGPGGLQCRNLVAAVSGYIEVLGDEVIFTSGNYERFREDQTERYPHIIDPSTGWPAKDIASVTIITDDGLLADAAATALVVAGLDEWSEVARALGLNQVAIVDESGTIYLTPQMQQRIHFSDDEHKTIVVNTQ